MTFVQAGTGWTEPKADADGEEEIAEEDNILAQVNSREPWAG